jgi:hypothetical protein
LQVWWFGVLRQQKYFKYRHQGQFKSAFWKMFLILGAAGCVWPATFCSNAGCLDLKKARHNSLRKELVGFSCAGLLA